MHSMNIKDFDLNLLPVFDAVMATGNVSRAAERTGLSQPAVSHALTRLRLALKDPLFVRAPGGVRPTAKAEHFARYAGAALRTLDVALQESDRFDPATTERRFTVHMSDLATGELLPRLMAALHRHAPGLRPACGWWCSNWPATPSPWRLTTAGSTLLSATCRSWPVRTPRRCWTNTVWC
jgi:DNA-binding transcriptional LysR family regulator